MKKIDKKKMASIIRKKLNGALSRKAIYDAITIIDDSIIESLIEDKAFSVVNFGTFSPHLFHEHEGMNISKGILERVKPFRTVKFRAHANFLALVAQRKDKFKDP